MNPIELLTANPLVLLIPLISGIVGWGTNALAILMMFRPREFVGIPPLLGWQGIIPRFTPKAGLFAADLVADQLLDLKDVMQDFDAHSFVANIQDGADLDLDSRIEQEIQGFAPDLWNALGPEAKGQVLAVGRDELLNVATGILHDMSGQIDQIIDLKHIVIDSLERDNMLLANIMQRVSGAEIRFIRNSGLYFGFLFGIVQMLVWVFFPAWWLLPAAGFLVGYVTNYMALFLLFDPKEPIKIGPFTFQGMMHKRQQAIADGVAAEIAEVVLNPHIMIGYMTSGDSGNVLFSIIRNNIDALIDKYRDHPMAPMLMASVDVDQVKDDAMARIEQELRSESGPLGHFIEGAIDVVGEITGKINSFTPATFEGLFRPIFQQEEWILCAVGGLLGIAAGWAQVVWLFADLILP